MKKKTFSFFLLFFLNKKSVAISFFHSFQFKLHEISYSIGKKSHFRDSLILVGFFSSPFHPIPFIHTNNTDTDTHTRVKLRMKRHAAVGMFEKQATLSLCFLCFPFTLINEHCSCCFKLTFIFHTPLRERNEEQGVGKGRRKKRKKNIERDENLDNSIFAHFPHFLHLSPSLYFCRDIVEAAVAVTWSVCAWKWH